MSNGVRAKSGKVVLVVEDDSAVRRAVARILTQAGYRVLEADNGANALRLLECEDPLPDLVITDLMMPVLGGLELGERLRTRYPTLKLLFMTGYCEDLVRGEGGDLVRGRFMQKPFSVRSLTNRVKQALSRGANLQVG